MKRAALVLLALGALLLPACARRAPRPSDAIVFWTYEDAAVLPQLAGQFERENPGLRVQIVNPGTLVSQDSAAPALPGVPPPDLREFSPRIMPALLASGALADWSAGVADLRDSLRGWPACMVGDAIYGVPFRLDVTALVWNPWLFQRVGLDRRHAPATWAEVRTAALRLQKLGHGARGLGIAMDDTAATLADFLPWALSHGGGVRALPPDSESACVEGNRSALEFLLSLRKATLLAPRDTLEREFALGRLGMLLADGASQRSLERFATGIQPAVAPVPRADPDSACGVTFASVSVLASPAHAKHKEGALRLARFLALASSQLALHRHHDRSLPSSLAAESVLVARGGPAARARYDMLAAARYPQPVARWSAMEGALGAAVRDALLGRLASDSALALASTRIATLGGRK